MVDILATEWFKFRESQNLYVTESIIYKTSWQGYLMLAGGFIVEKCLYIYIRNMKACSSSPIMFSQSSAQ